MAHWTSGFPPIAKKLIHMGGILMGSTAVHGLRPGKDIDIVIPHALWAQAVLLVPEDCDKSTYGGWRFRDGDFEIDTWPDYIERLLVRPGVNHFRLPDGRLFGLLEG